MTSHFFDKIDRFSISREGFAGIKSAIIWAHKKGSNVQFPIMYIRKPKHVSQMDFKEILQSMELSFKKKL